MPVPVWECTDLGLLDEPLDTATVVSEDIWKKFDLDSPLDDYYQHERAAVDDGMILPEVFYEKTSFQEARKIRHHDCMWAGLCISKEHNRTLPAKKSPQIHKKVPAGRSLLISRANPSHATTTTTTTTSSTTTNNVTVPSSQQQQQQQSAQQQSCNRAKNLDSDGDSTRPDTPQTSSSSDTETEDEAPVFKHDQINIHERLSECMSETATKAVHVSEVTGQLVRRMPERKKSEEQHCYAPKETDVSTTLSDHCYHINQPANKKLEHLGVQTPSDSEEEIDVVNFEKPSRPAALPTYPSPAEQRNFQLTVSTAFREKPASVPPPPATATTTTTSAAASSTTSTTSASTTPATPTPRPRGRPPSSGNRKKTVVVDVEEKPARRTRQRPYEKKSAGRNARSMTSRSSSDSEAESEKRSLHNNMERQRRIELRNAFEELRMLVPEIEMKDKAPKVAILRQAARYCDLLTETEQITLNTMEELRRRQERLRARLSHLRRCLAQKR